jgi:hypothetical protein
LIHFSVARVPHVSTLCPSRCAQHALSD